MKLSLKLFSLGVLFGGFLAHAEPKLEDFYGFRVGMSEKEVLSAAKEKGFPHFVDSDKKSQRRPYYEPGTCFRRIVTGRDLPMPYHVIMCMGRKQNLDSINIVAFEVFDEKVFALSAVFEPIRGKQAMSAILGKFGFPDQSRYLSGHRAKKGTAEQLRCTQKTCNESKWENSTRRLTVSYIGSSPESGEAIKLSLVDITLMAKLKLFEAMDVIEKGAADAKELGF